MKLIIFLLLLSANCLGQKTPRGTDSIVTELYNSPLTIHGEDSVRVFKNGIATWTTMQCSHKWVELHQDTVKGCDYPVASIGELTIKIGYHKGMNIICLICHEQKQQIIDYGESPHKVFFNRIDSVQTIGVPYSDGRIEKNKVIHYKRDK